MTEQGWAITNGNVMKNEEEELTYAGKRGEWVIDYAIRDERTKEKIKL